VSPAPRTPAMHLAEQPRGNKNFDELAVLRPLQRQFPSAETALAEIARLRAELTLPKGTVHVISDVHGDDVKLRHVINNASGTLRPLVEKLFADRFSARELQEFLPLLFSPKEALERLDPRLPSTEERSAFARRVLHALFELGRHFARRQTLKRVLS